MRQHHAAHGVDQIFGLQVGKLLLLITELNIEQVVVDLRDNRFQRNATLHARRAHDRGHNAAGIHKPRRTRSGQRSLFKEPRGMPRGRHLLDALPERAGAAADVKDLGLVQRNLHRAGPDEVCCRVNICKGCVHKFSPPPWGCFSYQPSAFSF